MASEQNDRFVSNYSVTITIGILMVIVYSLQLITATVFGIETHNNIFVLESDQLGQVWTWITSIFAHSPASPMHIIGNGLILVFFGTIAERILGSARYALLFISAGILTGIGQIFISIALGTTPSGVLGASGALFTILGLITIKRPNMLVFLYFLFPLPLWVLTLGAIGVSVLGIFTGVFAGIAHGAHLIGIVIGLLYGSLKDI